MKKRHNNTSKRRITFSLYEDTGCEVFLAGDFNNWTPEFMNYIDKSRKFEKVKMLKPGRYEYKFVVNGNWRVDASNDNFAYNDQGSMNSMLIVE